MADPTAQAPTPMTPEEVLDARSRALAGGLSPEELALMISRLRVSRISESGQSKAPRKKKEVKSLSDADLDAMFQ